MNIAETLLEFRKSQNPKVLRGMEDVANDTLNIISISILSWLELEQKRLDWIAQGKKTKLKPMSLNYQFPWCAELRNLLSEYFEIFDNEMRFKSCISENQRNEIRNYAFEHNVHIRCV